MAQVFYVLGASALIYLPNALVKPEVHFGFL